MRFLIAIIICLTCKFAFSQDSLYKHLPLKDGKVIYERVIKVDSTSKDVLYERIKDWADDYYNKPRKALKDDDKESGYISYEWYIPCTLIYHQGMFEGKQFSARIYHTLMFYVKDNEIRLVFTNLEIQNLDALNASTKMQWKKKIERLDDGLENRSDKRQEKINDSNERHARRINRLVTEFLAEMQEKLTSKHS